MILEIFVIAKLFGGGTSHFSTRTAPARPVQASTIQRTLSTPTRSVYSAPRAPQAPLRPNRAASVLPPHPIMPLRTFTSHHSPIDIAAGAAVGAGAAQAIRATPSPAKALPNLQVVNKDNYRIGDVHIFLNDIRGNVYIHQCQHSLRGQKVGENFVAVCNETKSILFLP